MRRPAKSVVLGSAVIAAFALFGSSEAGALATASAAPAISAAASVTAVVTPATPTPPPATNDGNDPWD